MTGLAPLVCRRSIEVYSPNSGDAGSREVGRGERGREGRMAAVLKSTRVKCVCVREEKFLFVVMVTGSVVCSENISLA